MSGVALSLIAEARRLGLTIRADGDRIKVKPAEKLPLDLAQRIKANRLDVLAVLRSLPGETPTVKAGPATPDDPLPVRWKLDDLDRRVLLQCGILPTPDVDHLPEPWRIEYQRHAARLVKLGVHVEEAEHIAIQETLRRMLACGDLELPEGW